MKIPIHDPKAFKQAHIESRAEAVLLQILELDAHISRLLISARRAREKAIEECAQKAFLAVGLVSGSRKLSDDVCDAVRSLKSPTN